jgi:hypothetical protein
MALDEDDEFEDEFDIKWRSLAHSYRQRYKNWNA